MTWYEYSCILSGHILRSARESEHTRAIVYTLVLVNSTDRNLPPPHEFMPLITDKKETIVRETTLEERIELSQKAYQRAALLFDKNT